jgi:DNA-binding response OmpR family regulator
MTSKGRVLVVDDSRSLVRIVERTLQKAGFEVLTAFDGLEGLRKAREEKPNLIILDVVMPEMDGYEVCRHLESDPDTAAIPVLMLTVKGQVDDPDVDEKTFNARLEERMEAFEAGATDFLSKPVAAEELLGRVRSLLWLNGLDVPMEVAETT